MQVISKKVILLGNFNAGKTSLINRFVYDSFNSNYHSTIGVKISKSSLSVDSQFSINMIIWDIAGANLKYSIPNSYLNGASGMIYVVDLTQTNQFDNCKNEIISLEKKYPKEPLVVIGNKVDLIPTKEVDALVNSSGIEFNLLCSAKTGENVHSLFLKLAQTMVKKTQPLYA